MSPSEPSSRGRRARRLVPVAAGRFHLALASGIVVAVFVQVYLIGSYIFGAGQSALDARRTMGFTTHGLELLTSSPHSPRGYQARIGLVRLGVTRAPSAQRGSLFADDW